MLVKQAPYASWDRERLRVQAERMVSDLSVFRQRLGPSLTATSYGNELTELTVHRDCASPFASCWAKIVWCPYALRANSSS